MPPKINDPTSATRRVCSLGSSEPATTTVPIRRRPTTTGGCVQTGIGARNVEEAPRTAGQASSGGVHAGARARLLEQFAAREDPDVRVRARGVRGIQERQPTVIHAEQRALLRRARAQHVARVLVEAVGEQDVEADEQCGHCRGDHRDDHEQQAAAYPEWAHWSR